MNWEVILPKLQTFGINLAIAIVIFIVGNWIAKAVSKFIRNLLLKRKTDITLASFLCNIIYAVLLLIVVLSALNRLGVNTASFMVIVGAATLAIGMAMQGQMGNFAAGAMLVMLRPFKIGDTVIAGGQTGTVHDIGIMATTLLTSDNKKIIVPNSAIAGGAITNFSAMPTRKIEFNVVVPGSTDLNKGRDIIRTILNAEPRILKVPAPGIAIADANATEIKFAVSAHVNNSEMGAVQSDLLEKIKLILTEAGIWV